MNRITDLVPFGTPVPAVKSPVTGARRRLPVDGAGNIIITQTVGLLTQGGLSWGPWAITLDPMSSNGYPTSPWPPGGGFGRTGEPRAIVRFGVGGLTRVVEFDYPFSGGCFVVNTDRVEVAVRATRAGAVDPNNSPQVGAWLTPASQQAVPTPLVLTNPGTLFNFGTAFIPPGALFFVISIWDSAAPLAAGSVDIDFTDFGGSQTFRYSLAWPAGGPPEPFRVPIPPQATVVGWTGTVGDRTSSMFELSFA